MPDQYAPSSIIQNNFTSGELTPELIGRTDLQKYHNGALKMQNMVVNFRGGCFSRPGSQFMGQAGSAGYVRLIPWIFSPDIGQSYMLVLAANTMRFIKNPGGSFYPNSSNAGFIMSAGSPYTISTPWAAVDLPFLKFQQIGDLMTITRHGYRRQLLQRFSDTNWTLTPIPIITPTPNKPTNLSFTITAKPTSSTDPVNTAYGYAVSAVDTNGVEGPAEYTTGGQGIDIGTTQGTVSFFWSPPAAGANPIAFYKVYKCLPTPGAVLPSKTDEFGFAGFAYGNTFHDSNVVPDFSRQPISSDDPFRPSKIIGYSITSSSGDWPVNGTSLTVTDATGSGAILIPVLDNNAVSGLAHITGIFILDPGQGYTAPTVAAVGAGGTSFVATLTVGAASGLDPDVVGLFQQRLVYASSLNFPTTLWGARPGATNDFRTNNPPVDSDAYTFNIASSQINDVVWLQPMPGGLVIGTNSGILQLTGGSASPANPLAVTPTSAVIVPQSYYGSADLKPIVINYDILYCQIEGSVIRDLQYNFFVNIYTGIDITTLASHLFYPHTIVSWDYQDQPNKVIWAVREDGALLALTFLKEQEVIGWTFNTNSLGTFEAVAVVREGSQDACYVTLVDPSGNRFICRMTDHIFNQADDAWQLDLALSTPTTFPNAALTLSALSGNGVTVTASSGVFSAGNVNGAIRFLGGRGYITSFTDSQHVTMNVSPGYPFRQLQIIAGVWRLDNQVSTVSGLTHLAGFSNVSALIDGVGYSGLTVSGGGVLTLPVPGTSVVVGLPFVSQLQPMPLDVGGETTLQGRRKKVTALSVRVKDSAGFKIGRTLNDIRLWTQGLSSTDPQTLIQPSMLLTGDARVVLPQTFDVYGQVFIQQDSPLPLQVLSLTPEVAQGDTK